MLHIYFLTSNSALPYQRFTYQSYREWLTSPNTQPPGKTLMIAADFLNQPAGLLLCHLPIDHRPPRLLSLFVAERFRNLGIATSLINHMKEELKRLGTSQAEIEYLNLKHTKSLERVLQKTGWHSPVIYSRYYRFEIKEVRKSKWIHRFKLAKNYQLVPWDELSRSELEDMNELQETGFAGYFKPHNKSATLVANCSLVIKEGSQIAGWSLVDREIDDILLYRALYIREAYRDRGLGPALAAQTTLRALETDASYGNIQIRADNQPMIKMAKRLIEPFHPVVTEYKTALLAL